MRKQCFEHFVEDAAYDGVDDEIAKYEAIGFELVAMTVWPGVTFPYKLVFKRPVRPPA